MPGSFCGVLFFSTSRAETTISFVFPHYSDKRKIFSQGIEYTRAEGTLPSFLVLHKSHTGVRTFCTSEHADKYNCAQNLKQRGGCLYFSNLLFSYRVPACMSSDIHSMNDHTISHINNFKFKRLVLIKWYLIKNQ